MATGMNLYKHGRSNEIYIALFSILMSSMFKQKPLPFAINALEPIISANTIEHHYHGHHKNYVDKLNQLLPDTHLGLTDVLLKYTDNPKIWNNAAQHHHHEFFWESLTDKPTQVIPEFNRKVFAESCLTLFGSGWVWWTHDGMQYHIEQTNNADFPRFKPLLVVDVWEHAYYLDYQQHRAKYIDKVIELLNWDMARHRLESDNPLY